MKKFIINKKTLIITLFSSICFGLTIFMVYGSYSPQSSIPVDGDRTHVVESNIDTYVTSHYNLTLTDYDSKKNETYYNITSYYYFEGTAILYSDNVYVNDVYVGTFSTNNGKHDAGNIYRTESLPAVLKSGWNIFKTTDADGVGGASFKRVKINDFATPPEVIGTDGTWYEGEVETGLRTWQSLYTDGATGSAEGNKVQTSTGFMYVDADEQTTPVNSYSNTVIGQNSRITEIKDAFTGINLPLDINIFNNEGTYWIKSCTTDSGELEGCGSRYIRVLSRKYNIGYAGNGATSGGTSSQTCTVLYNCTLNSNGFRRDFSVDFNGNGGSSSQTSGVASASFLGWMDHNNFNYKGAVYPYWTFNAPFYANYNTDVRNYAGYSKTALIDHWLSTSITNAYENRQSSEFFNIAHYMTYGGGDLNAAFGGHRASYVNHYTYNGYHEGRSASAPIGGQYDTYPDRATVRDLSMDDGANLTLTAKWRDGSVVLPNATRPGYKLIGWYTAPNGGSKVGNAGETYTPTSSTTVYAKWDKAPTISASDQTFYEGQYKSDYWISTQRLKGVSASDQEDGNITSKIKVIEDTTNLNVPGTYKVTYQVSDSVGQTVNKTVKITVLYNNPPVINANDRWFYLDEEVTNARLLEKTHAQDIEDGDITRKITVKSSNVVQEVGIYDVTFTVTDAFGKSATKDIKVHIVDFTHHVDNYYIRYISKEFLYTLDYGSRWRNDPILSAELQATLNKEPTDENALYVIEWNDELNYQMKDFFRNVPMDKNKNQKFIDQFGDIFKKEP